MRAFIAVDLPAEIKDLLAKIQDKLKLSLPKISWVKPLNLHLTLAFLGEISDPQLKDVKKIICETAKISKKFKIKLENLGVIPDIRRARIIWIGTNQMPQPLEQIAGGLKIKLSELGLAQEDRDFLAHITLGRIRERINPGVLEKVFKEVKNLSAFGNFEFEAKGITLFESILGPVGPAYNVIEEVTFKIT